MNIRLDIAYDGSSFSGWQRQVRQVSVQQALEEGLSALLKETVRVSGSGRTDAGAHAFCYTVSFFCEHVVFPVGVLPRLLVSFLPPTIVPLRAMAVPDEFHARFSATAREYVYLVWRGEVGYPFLRSYAHHGGGDVDFSLVQQACLLFAGEHDFRSFCYGYGREEKKVDFRRRVYYFRVAERGQWLVFCIKGNGFLRGMIRTLVGVCLQAGWKKISLTDIRETLNGSYDIPTFLKKPVTAAGLYFKRAYYPQHFLSQVEHF